MAAQNTQKTEETSIARQQMDELVQGHLAAVNGFFTPALADRLDALAARIVTSLDNGGKVLLCGNGGSAADAQHIAAEFVGRFIKDRPSLAAIALTTDTSAITAIGNDYGYDDVFSRQVAGLGQKGDIFIGITTSGNSANVLRAFDVAKEKGIHTVALSGRDGGKANGFADESFIVPSSITAHIQECHITFMHMMCGMVERRMGFDS